MVRFFMTPPLHDSLISQLFRTAYLVSLASYLAFLLFEWLRPGFVSDIFSPHLFLAAAIVFGVLWGRKAMGNEKEEGGMGVVIWTLGMLLAWVVWKEGRPLEEFRVLVTLMALVLPFVIYKNLYE